MCLIKLEIKLGVCRLLVIVTRMKDEQNGFNFFLIRFEINAEERLYIVQLLVQCKETRQKVHYRKSCAELATFMNILNRF